jgi:zinc D-Ala-D-Ala dipeptidase
MPISISRAWAAAAEMRRLPLLCLLWATAWVPQAVAAEPVQVSPATTPEQAGLVDIATLVPGIRLDIRYAGRDNFVGEKVQGYLAPKCYLLRPVAETLQRVEQDLRQQGLALKIFDCYRPVRSVKHFVAWAADRDDRRTKPVYYPNLDKHALLDGGYIAESSGHSRGATVDLTVVRCEAGDCAELDMGTAFDFFDARANTDHAGIAPAQRANRQLLVDAMARHGFRNYPMEWWHYTLQPEPTPHTAYDVPVQ